MKKLALLLVVASLFVASPVMAEEQVESVTTRHLYNACMDTVYDDDTLTTSTYCRAFIQGAVNAHTHLTSYYSFPKQFCLPEANVDKKIAGIFIKTVDENRIFFEKPAISALYYALRDAFPCTESTPKK